MGNHCRKDDLGTHAAELEDELLLQPAALVPELPSFTEEELRRRNRSSNASRDQRNQEQDQKDHKQGPGDLRRDRRDAEHTQGTGDQGDDQEKHRKPQSPFCVRENVFNERALVSGRRGDCMSYLQRFVHNDDPHKDNDNHENNVHTSPFCGWNLRAGVAVTASRYPATLFSSPRP